MNKFWNKIKFYLGLPVVANHAGLGWVVTKRQLGLFRVCKSVDSSYWWFGEDMWPKYCLFKTKEEAEKALKTKRFDVNLEVSD